MGWTVSRLHSTTRHAFRRNSLQYPVVFPGNEIWFKELLVTEISTKPRCKSRQTVLIWDTNPHTPRLYFKSAPPLHLPRHNDLLGLHRLITGMEMYYASPAESRLPVAPLVKCGGSWCLDVYH